MTKVLLIGAGCLLAGVVIDILAAELILRIVDGPEFPH